MKPMNREHPKYEEFQLARKGTKHENSNVRSKSAHAFGDIGHPDAIPHLAKALNDQDQLVRENAAWALGKIGHPNGFKPLTAEEKGINDEHEKVRERATWALGKIRHPGAIHHLVEALNDEHYLVRWKAAWALGKIGHPDGIKPLTVEEKGINDERKSVRLQSIWAIGKIAEAIKEEQPEHPAVIATQHINPEEHANAFVKLYKALERGEHKGKPPEWITTYAKQLKALEGNLK